MRRKRNRFIDVTVPFTVGFLVATLSYKYGLNPYIAFVVGETAALFSAWLIRFLIRVSLRRF